MSEPHKIVTGPEGLPNDVNDPMGRFHRLDRQQYLIEHNQRMLKLRVNGQAYRDKLISERLRLRSAGEHGE